MLIVTTEGNAYLIELTQNLMSASFGSCDMHSYKIDLQKKVKSCALSDSTSYMITEDNELFEVPLSKEDLQQRRSNYAVYRDPCILCIKPIKRHILSNVPIVNMYCNKNILIFEQRHKQKSFEDYSPFEVKAFF